MRQLVAPGKAIEAVTPDELRAELDARERERQDDARVLRTSENVFVPASGNVTLDEIHVCPLGFEVVLYRWEIANVAGFNPGTLFTAAAGWIDLLVDEMRVDWIRLQNGIPNIVTWSENQGPIYRNGQRLGIAVNGGPASANIETRVQGIIRKAERR